MKISVVGLGFVGLSLASFLATKGFNVIGIDNNDEKRGKIIQGQSPFFEPRLQNLLRKALKMKLEISDDFSLIKDSDFIFVTVGTPQKEDGSIELSFIKKAAKSIAKNINGGKNKPIILIKSTVVPGTIENNIMPILEKNSKKQVDKEFGLISNPEFLQEGSAVKNTKYPHLIVLGGSSTKFLEKTNKFFLSLHPNTPIIKTNYQTAELIKYANNSFLATKISFINQIANICERVPNSNIDDIAKAIGMDPRIGNLFLNAGPGFGGSCLPKDLKAIINFAKKTGSDSTFLNAVEDVNKTQINNIISIIKKSLGTLERKRITVLGISFKPNTDDIRESKSIELIKKLINNKANVIVHDPKSQKNTFQIFGNKIQYSDTLVDSIKKSQCMIIMTEWNEYRNINNSLLNNMSKKLVIDCRRILSDQKLDAEYYAIGIGKD